MFYQSEISSPGALFCPSRDECGTVDLTTPGSYSLAFGYQTIPEGAGLQFAYSPCQVTSIF